VPSTSVGHEFENGDSYIFKVTNVAR
jgi:hypothetical protein